MNVAGPKSAKIVGSARNAMRILDWLSRRERPVRLADIAGPLGNNPSTCLNIMQTLAEDGFIVAQEKRYALGPEAVHLAYPPLKRSMTSRGKLAQDIGIPGRMNH